MFCFFLYFSGMKKMYYIPGIFSIILLPVLGIWYLNTHGYFLKLTAINVNFIQYEEVSQLPKDDFFYKSYEVFTKTNYKEIFFDKNKSNSKEKLQLIDNLVRKKLQQRDSLNGLKITFADDSTYDDFIQTLDILYKNNTYAYNFENNSIYFIPLGIYEESNLSGCFLIKEDSLKDKKKFQIHFSQNKIIYSAYFIFFTFAVVLFIIRHKKR